MRVRNGVFCHLLTIKVKMFDFPRLFLVKKYGFGIDYDLATFVNFCFEIFWFKYIILWF